LDKFRWFKYAKLHCHGLFQTVATNYNSEPTWIKDSDNNSKNNRNKFSNRYSINIQSIKYYLATLLNIIYLSPTIVRASDVGGVSATANPVANSSGSVTNQAIQVLQGPYITNTYGNGVQCQGPTLNITPFLTTSNSWKEPYEAYYNDPVFDTSDSDNDGVMDNPGTILYYKPTRTGQKANHNIGWGISATISIPLSKRHNESCLTAATSQNKLTQQLIANKRLDFEMARLKHCAEQKKLGVSFHPKSPSYQICADIVVTNPHGVIPNHEHVLSSESSTSSNEQ